MPTSPMLPSSKEWPRYYTGRTQDSQDKRLQRFYQAGCVDPQTSLRDTDFVAMDFETTGLNPDTDAIVSIGLVPFSLARIHCRNARHYVVKPRRDLATESIVIHGITHSDIEQAPDLGEILDQLLPEIAHKIVVVHYRHIERNFFDGAVMQRLKEHILFPVIDTMSLEERVCKNQQSFMERLMKRPIASLRLPDIRERYGLPRYHLHHAMTDALATAELLQAQVAHHFDEKQSIQDLWE